MASEQWETQSLIEFARISQAVEDIAVALGGPASPQGGIVHELLKLNEKLAVEVEGTPRTMADIWLRTLVRIGINDPFPPI